MVNIHYSFLILFQGLCANGLISFYINFSFFLLGLHPDKKDQSFGIGSGKLASEKIKHMLPRSIGKLVPKSIQLMKYPRDNVKGRRKDISVSSFSVCFSWCYPKYWNDLLHPLLQATLPEHSLVTLVSARWPEVLCKVLWVRSSPFFYK